MKKTFLTVFLSLCLLAAALSVAAQAEYPLTLQDMMGREVSIDAPVTRIVALTAADCEILCALGAGDLLVGRGAYCDYPAEIADLPAVQSGASTNLEQVLELNPQVVVTSAMDQTEEQIAALENAGVRVVETDADDIEGVYESIRLLGALTGRTENALSLVEKMRATFSSVAADAGEASGKTVYFEVSPLQYGLWTAGQGTFMNEIAQMLGLKNCFDDVTGWASISEEAVLERNPDYIVTITMYYGEGPTPTEEIMARAGWQEVTAVKNHAILNLQGDELSRPGPRLADGARMMYDFLNG